MRRFWAVVIFSVFIVSLLVWGHIRSGIAEEQVLSITKPERYYSIRLSKKLDEVLSNQALILKELEELKKAVKK